jgi:uncharacterized protein (TIGR00369 family)
MNLEQIEAQKGELNTRMGLTFLEADAQRTVATMPVEGNRQPFGLLHGGASGVLIETVGSIAATLHGSTMGMVAVGVELSVSHHRGVTEGTVTCVGTPLSLGRTLATYQCEVSDEQGRRVATGRLTCVLREPPR